MSLYKHKLLTETHVADCYGFPWWKGLVLSRPDTQFKGRLLPHNPRDFLLSRPLTLDSGLAPCSASL